MRHKMKVKLKPGIQTENKGKKKKKSEIKNE